MHDSFLTFLLASVALTGAFPPADALAREQSPPITQELLDGITTKCGAPTHWLRLRGNGSVQAQPSPKAEYRQVDCLLGRLREVAAPNIGFVGNESKSP